jgi:hypothetical protein
MRGTILLLPQYVFMAWCLVKHRDTFTFALSSVVLCSLIWFLFRDTRKSSVCSLDYPSVLRLFQQKGRINVLIAEIWKHCFVFS